MLRNSRAAGDALRYVFSAKKVNGEHTEERGSHRVIVTCFLLFVLRSVLRDREYRTVLTGIGTYSTRLDMTATVTVRSRVESSDTQR
jgi:hypothetical protein